MITRVTYLEVNHLPETLEVGGRRLLFSRVELAVVHQARELLEPLGHQQLGLAHHRPDLP